MPTQDQAVWANVNIAKSGGETVAYARGELLPDPETPEESSSRALLRIGGAIRTVEVVYTAEELAASAQASAAAGAARAAALDVDPAAPSGAQMPGSGPSGPPTLETPGATPVVIGPEPDPPAKTPAAKKDDDKGKDDPAVKPVTAQPPKGSGKP